MTAIRWADLGLATTIAVLLLLVEHWGPWQRLLQRRFHATVNYSLGVLAMEIPLTVLLITWGMLPALIALWVVTISGGLVVILAYAADGWIETRVRANIAEHEAQMLRPEAGNDPRADQ